MCKDSTTGFLGCIKKLGGDKNRFLPDDHISNVFDGVSPFNPWDMLEQFAKEKLTSLSIVRVGECHNPLSLQTSPKALSSALKTSPCALLLLTRTSLDTKLKRFRFFPGKVESYMALVQDCAPGCESHSHCKREIEREAVAYETYC